MLASNDVRQLAAFGRTLAGRAEFGTLIDVLAGTIYALLAPAYDGKVAADGSGRRNVHVWVHAVGTILAIWKMDAVRHSMCVGRMRKSAG